MCCSPVETSSELPRKSLKILHNLLKRPGNDQKRSYYLRTVFGEFSKIFGNHPTSSENLRKTA